MKTYIFCVVFLSLAIVFGCHFMPQPEKMPIQRYGLPSLPIGRNFVLLDEPNSMSLVYDSHFIYPAGLPKDDFIAIINAFLHVSEIDRVVLSVTYKWDDAPMLARVQTVQYLVDLQKDCNTDIWKVCRVSPYWF